MPDSLKISYRTGKRFYGRAWNAGGVDYGNESFEGAQDKDYNDQQQASDNYSNL